MNEALILLVLVWAVLIVPGAVRSRNASPHVTVGGFERAMDVLRSDARGASGGRQVFVPGDAGRIVERPTTSSSPPPPLRHRAEDPVVVRRRVWFVRTIAATGITFLLAVIGGGGWLWLPFLLSVALMGGYAAVLRHLKLQRDEARRVVRELELPRAGEDVATETPPVGLTAAGGSRGSDAEPPFPASGTVRLRRWDD